MTIHLQKILEEKNYLPYLRTHSKWYKYLNRDESYLKNMKEEMKEERYHTFSNQISNVASTIEMIENMITTLK